MHFYIFDVMSRGHNTTERRAKSQQDRGRGRCYEAETEAKIFISSI